MTSAGKRCPFLGWVFLEECSSMNHRAQSSMYRKACDLGMAERIEPVVLKDKDDRNLHKHEICTLSPKSSGKQVISSAEGR